ncbi:MAG: metallophosphoesterase [Cardiobacteriaceae bacterium]|nr:metallophosphoesterase [Cardiobacteriaceae bacterium]
MRTIYFLRGLPASGKSFWIKENNLSPYTISSDEIRLMYASPVIDNDGNYSISQKYDKKVWNLIFNLLEEKMGRGEFIIVDATHYRDSSLREYKKLINYYRYRPFVVDFTNIELNTILNRNQQRESYKIVPEQVIYKMHKVLEQNNNEIYPKLSPKAAIEQLNKSLIFDFNHYEKVIIFGDIHGCFTPLNHYFQENPFSENNAYIFLGDYVDRGIEHHQTFELLLSIYHLKNVLVLEGNHERWLRFYAEDDEQSFARIKSKTFLEKTAPELKNLDKKDLRQFCRALAQMAYFSFAGKEYFASHGGVGCLPHLFINTQQYINGVGGYEDTEQLYNAWEKNTADNCVLIHGHRNTENLPAQVRSRCYNLCSEIEYGDSLRVLEISRKGEEIKEYRNPIYDKNLPKKLRVIKNNRVLSDNELLNQLNLSPLIIKKSFDNGIISYNFSRDAFYKKEWNNLTCRARGLFIFEDRVICRSYNKFFNWYERKETSDEELEKNLCFPVRAYRKENGFLAMVSVFNNELLVCSKSTISGTFVGYINNFLERLSEDTRKAIFNYCQKNNVSFVFECVDIANDPHIVQYQKPHLYLLDIVQNDFEFKKIPYEELIKIAEECNLEYKKLEKEFNSWKELNSYKNKLEESLNLQKREWSEGLVLEDKNGFMLKYKNPNYRLWKQLRSVLERLQTDKQVTVNNFSQQAQEVIKLMQNLKVENKLNGLKITDIQNIYWNS